ncbi:MAG: type II toxin-antitoxin system HicB family antitoxin [Candidatus ainarchaeum sp.]|nr:type II toxin-antitoxin system HicB family antitoxin [Candidatus ainarchaeum sp.]
MDYRVSIQKDEEGFFIANCIDLKGCISDGKTKKEAIENIKEAIQAYNESIAKEKIKLITIDA